VNDVIIKDSKIVDGNADEINTSDSN